MYANVIPFSAIRSDGEHKQERVVLIYYIERCPRRRPLGGVSQGYLLSPICPTVNNCNEWQTWLTQEPNPV